MSEAESLYGDAHVQRYQETAPGVLRCLELEPGPEP